MNTLKKPPIHLWIYNHPLTGISDQVGFFVMAFKQHGYSVSIGRQPRHSALNAVIENFSTHTKEVLMDFCRSSRKRVAVIMTEHLDFDSGKIFIHGDPLWSDNDYMHPATQLSRIRNLVDCLPCLRCFFVLGDLPELRNMSAMLPGIDVRSIPFPRLAGDPITDIDTTSEAVNDLVFTGAITSYRGNLLALLEAVGMSVACPQAFVSKKRRNAMNRSARMIVNIPQREGWRWLSLMRIVAGLQTGRATISLGTSDVSQIASCCTQLDIRKQDWMSEVKQCVDDWKSLYIRDVVSYSVMAKKFEQERPFPHDVFEYWSITDRVCS
jgi:hypothetical protein